MEVENRTSEKTLSGELCKGEKIQERRRGGYRRRVITFAVISVINVALLALLWSQLFVPTQSSSTDSTQSKSPLEGRPAPNFMLAQLTTDSAPPIRLADFKGKPMIINFWASWCDPCKREAPLLQSTWQRAQKQGVVMLGIDYQDTNSDGLAFLQKYGITYKNVVDVQGKVSIDYGVADLPETFFINSRGIVVRRVLGELTEQTLQKNIQQI